MNMAVQERNVRGRKPIQMELVGGKPIRQRVWEQIRINQDKFQIGEVAHSAEVKKDTAKRYVQCLERGGYVVKLGEGDYQLIKNNGIEAPRLNEDGQPVTMGLMQEAIWKCLRALGATDAFKLLGHAEAGGIEVTINHVRKYLRALKKAGYLKVVHRAVGARGEPEVITLIPKMDTGPRPPQIQRVGVVYDPNLNQVMHADDPQEAL